MADPIRVEVFDIPTFTDCFSGGWGPSWSPEEITAIVRAEIERRYGDDAKIEYFNVEDTATRADHSQIVDEIETKGLLYPVTVLDGVPLYDGAVSYPAILRAVHNKLAEREQPAEAAGA